MAGPTFLVELVQPNRDDGQELTVGFDGRVCIKLDSNNRCLNVRVGARSELPPAPQFGGGSATNGRQLLVEFIRSSEYGRYPSLLTPVRRQAARERAPPRFTHFYVKGEYVEGPIEPLRALPDFPPDLANLVTIRADEHHPLMLELTVNPLANTREMIIDFSCRLRFQMPSFFINAQDLELDIFVWGIIRGSSPKLGFGPIGTGGLTLPGGLIDTKKSFFAISTFNERPWPRRPLGFGGPMVDVPYGITIYYEGPSPVPEICAHQLLFYLTIQSLSTGALAAVCNYDLRLFDRRRNDPFLIPSVNAIHLFNMMIVAVILGPPVVLPPGELQLGIDADFDLATGQAHCDDRTESECLNAFVSIRVGVNALFFTLQMSLECSGVWVNPLNLRNFAIINPHFAIDLDMMRSPPAPLPNVKLRKISWAATLLYKPDVLNRRSNWPVSLFSSKRNWPAAGPDLSQWETQVGPTSVRRCSSYFLLEVWHPNIGNYICRVTGLPRFAVRLVIPRLTLIDVMNMYVDMHLSIYTTMGQVGEPDISNLPAAPQLMQAVSELLLNEFSVHAELSTIDVPGGLPEWGGVAIRRGLLLNATSFGSFLGFSWDFFIDAIVQIPDPCTIPPFPLRGPC